MAQFRFVMRSGPALGKVYPLEAPDISIGRDNTNMVVINDGEVSRRHARVELRGSTYVIQDLGSTNGTFVNGTRVSGTQVLNPGDMVSLGEGIVLVYEAAVDAAATILSSKPALTAIQQPAHAPAPASVPIPVPAPTPKPAPVFSGQVPAGPIPMPPESALKKKKFPVWLIIVIILLLIVCVCIGFFLVIDQLGLWCKVVPFLVPLLGGTC